MRPVTAHAQRRPIFFALFPPLVAGVGGGLAVGMTLMCRNVIESLGWFLSMVALIAVTLFVGYLFAAPALVGCQRLAFGARVQLACSVAVPVGAVAIAAASSVLS